MIAATPTTHQHITLANQSIPWIKAANTKVVELVANVKAHRWSSEDLIFQHPHLTLGQIHSRPRLLLTASSPPPGKDSPT